MSRAKKAVAVLFAAIIVVVTAVSVYLYRDINRRFPQREVCAYEMGDILSYCGYDISVKEVELLQYWDFKEKYSYEDIVGVEPYVDENETHVFLFWVTITNPNASEMDMPPVVGFTLQTNSGYSTAYDHFMYLSLHDMDTSALTDPLKPYESREVLMPYSVDAHYLACYDGVMLKVEDFDLSISVYPQKNYFELQ